MGDSGIDLSEDSRVQNVSVTYNGSDGVYLASGIISNVTAASNYGHGIAIGTGVVDHVSSKWNFMDGIYNGYSVAVMDSFSGGNKGFGLSGGFLKSVYRGSAFIDNVAGPTGGGPLLNGGGNLCDSGASLFTVRESVGNL